MGFEAVFEGLLKKLLRGRSSQHPSTSFIEACDVGDVRIDSSGRVPLAFCQKLRGSLRVGLCDLHNLTDQRLLLRGTGSWHCGVVSVGLEV